MSTSSLKFLSCVFAALVGLAACGEEQTNQEDPAQELMKRAIETSKRAGRYYAEQRLDSAIQLNFDALNMFLEVLKKDSTNVKAMSAVGFSYMMANDFEPAIPWFRRALSLDPTLAEARRQLGIAQIADGQVPQGKQNINESISQVDNPQARLLTMRELDRIGTEAHGIGVIHGKEDEPEQMKNQFRYSLAVLTFAHEIGGPDSALGRKIATYALELGDETTAEQFSAAYNLGDLSH